LVTKYRHQVFSSRHLEHMEQIMRDVCADFGCELAEFNGEPGHVHLLVNFPPTVAISRLVNSLKDVSSRRLRQEFPDPAPALLAGETPVTWIVLRRVHRRSPNSVLRQYIEQQERPARPAHVQLPSPPARRPAH